MVVNTDYPTFASVYICIARQNAAVCKLKLTGFILSNKSNSQCIITAIITHNYSQWADNDNHSMLFFAEPGEQHEHEQHPQQLHFSTFTLTEEQQSTESVCDIWSTFTTTRPAGTVEL